MNFTRSDLQLILICAFGLSGCSHSPIKKIEEGSLGQQVSEEVAQKFEVKDVTQTKVMTDLVKATVTPAGKAEEKSTPKKSSAVAAKSATVKKEDTTPPLRRPQVMPFDVGEKLSYDLRYMGITAATFNVEVRPLKMINDRVVHSLYGHMKTVKFFEMIYRVDDYIESFWDYQGMYSHRYTMDLDETKQNRKLIELYDSEKKRSYFWNRIQHEEKGYIEQKEQYDIKPYSQDIFSALYYLRVAPLPTKTSDPEYRFPVILDGKPWETSVKFLKKEKKYAGGRDFQANVYRIENFHNGESKNRENTVWISDDEYRYILRVETKVKIGTFAVALDRIL